MGTSAIQRENLPAFPIQSPWDPTSTHEHVRRHIDSLLDEYTDAQVANALNERGLRTGAGSTFDGESVQWVRFSHKLRSLKQRLLEAGWLTGKDMASRIGVKRTTLGRLRTTNRIKARICSDKGEWLYWPHDETSASHTKATAMGEDSSTGRDAL